VPSSYETGLLGCKVSPRGEVEDPSDRLRNRLAKIYRCRIASHIGRLGRGWIGKRPFDRCYDSGGVWTSEVVEHHCRRHTFSSHARAIGRLLVIPDE